MTGLLPNLESLLAVLPDTAAGRDAGRLAAEAATAQRWEEADVLIVRVVEGWQPR